MESLKKQIGGDFDLLTLRPIGPRTRDGRRHSAMQQIRRTLRLQRASEKPAAEERRAVVSDGTISIHAIFDNEYRGPNPAIADDVRQTLDGAEVILGVDVMSRRELDQESDELERACALMLVVKGRCDYE